MELKRTSVMRQYAVVKPFNCTLWNWNWVLRQGCRSHDTFNCTLWNWNRESAITSSKAVNLLIVPYGIETALLYVPMMLPTSFNCTLWNWNWVRGWTVRNGSLPFNCTLWNWNNLPYALRIGQYQLLIVPYGIETA